MKKTPTTILFSAFILLCNTLTSFASDKPNFIVIFTDDQGYEDLGCFGSPKIKTPHIDQMAKEGLRLTSFYVGAPVCSASRSSLLTGRYPARHGVGGAFFPNTSGLSPSEVTVAEVLKSQDYATACVGKWHLGDQDHYLPASQGFDEYFGVPYSNDMYIGPYQKFSGNITFNEGWIQQSSE